LLGWRLGFALTSIASAQSAYPTKLNFASPGTGTPTHLGGVLLMTRTGVKVESAP
jgi:Tripartite tricarboxylate transporter family receptor